VEGVTGIGTVLRTCERKDKREGFDSRTGIPVYRIPPGRPFISGPDGSLLRAPGLSSQNTSGGSQDRFSLWIETYGPLWGARRGNQNLTVLSETTMPLLPPEILDSILEHLLDKPATLKNCCLISKLWLPRVRRHLFAHVRFGISVSPVLWRKAFPDPSSSPGHHTHTLSISFKPVITGTDTGASNWIHTFHNVVHLELSFLSWAPLALYGLFPILRSLSLWCTPFDFSLICSFPLLEDLALVVPASLMDVERSNATLASPKLTGTLILEACGKIRSAIRPLLDRPGGIHFSKIRVTFCKEEAEPVSKLVSMCSKTLKSLTLFYHPSAFPSIIHTAV